MGHGEASQLCTKDAQPLCDGFNNLKLEEFFGVLKAFLRWGSIPQPSYWTTMPVVVRQRRCFAKNSQEEPWDTDMRPSPNITIDFQRKANIPFNFPNRSEYVYVCISKNQGQFFWFHCIQYQTFNT